MIQKLEFDGIEKSFDGRSLLSSIYMKCEVGKITGLLGRNGSGKSTLMKIVFGSLHTPFKSIRIDGKPLGNSYMKNKLIGYLSQGNWLPPRLTVKQALLNFEISPYSLLSEFPEFSIWLDFPARHLSGGYLRMLETYLLLFSSHPFVLLDEPFSGLMPKHIEELKKVIEKVKLQKGIIISDHLYRHILDLSDDLYLLSNGKTYLINEKKDLVFRGYLMDDDNLDEHHS